MGDRRRPSPGPALAAVRVTADDPDLRRLVAAWFVMMAGKWALLVTTLVLAYEVGGAVAVAILGLARFLTPALVAPFAGLPAARWRPERVLAAANGGRAIAVALMLAVVAGNLPVEGLYAATALEAGVGAFTRPLHMALLPAVARTPAQLVAANVSSSAAEGLGTFIGPALGSTLLVATGASGAIVAVLALYAVGSVSVARLEVPTVGRSSGDAGAILRQLLAGVRALGRYPGPRFVVLDFGMQTFVRGLLTVLLVIASIELLGLGEPGVGTLNAAMGLGGLLGAVGAIALAGRERLTVPFVTSLAAWGAPIGLIGLAADARIALVALVVVGIANSVLDVTGITLLQRLTPNESRVAVFGLFDSVANGGVALGGILAPVLVDAVGIRAALLVAAAVLPLTAIVSWPLLRRVDEGGPGGARQGELIRGDPLFAPLSLATVEHLAATLRPVRFHDASYLMRQGEPGDEYVLVDTGTIDVEVDGVLVDRLGAGAGVGEIALLRAVPRTASVRAVGPVDAFSLDRASFLEAVTGHRIAAAVADDRVRERLARR